MIELSAYPIVTIYASLILFYPRAGTREHHCWKASLENSAEAAQVFCHAISGQVSVCE